MKGSKTLIVAAVFATSAFAIQNNENLQPTDKYYVSPENAESVLKNLQKTADKKRPPLSSIAYFNGGTAKEESRDVHAPCFADEKQYEEIQISLINKWRSSWKKKELNVFTGLLLNQKVESNFVSKLGVVDQKISDNINLYKWNKSQKGSFSDYLAKFKVIEDID
ncbi:MAG: hypothetical protein ACLGG0_05475, partial [Bacteriovoracia bacterium]